MRNAAQAYQAVAKQTSSPRALEADLLLKAAARLKAVQDGWDASRKDLRHALLYNRRLWTIFLTSVTNKENPLPTALRQNIANLGVYVMYESMACSTDPHADRRLTTLININRELAAGLRGGGT
ncbi:MAG TPA: flagellar biosynthesis regulator FlaF [Xanthobacteraceae bacterium]|nr:flagellar biosynthesis regulator FlaF [Xanthobacteraceae bacterium]